MSAMRYLVNGHSARASAHPIRVVTHASRAWLPACADTRRELRPLRLREKSVDPVDYRLYAPHHDVFLHPRPEAMLLNASSTRTVTSAVAFDPPERASSRYSFSLISSKLLTI